MFFFLTPEKSYNYALHINRSSSRAGTDISTPAANITEIPGKTRNRAPLQFHQSQSRDFSSLRDLRPAYQKSHLTPHSICITLHTVLHIHHLIHCIIYVSPYTVYCIYITLYTALHMHHVTHYIAYAYNTLYYIYVSPYTRHLAHYIAYASPYTLHHKCITLYSALQINHLIRYTLHYICITLYTLLH